MSDARPEAQMIRRAPERPRRSVRLTDAEWRLIVAAAAARETYPSTYLREAAIREARRELGDPELHRDP